MSFDPKLLEVLACPICKGKLDYDKNQQILLCKFNKLEFPIKDGVPMMLVQAARPLGQNSPRGKR